MKLSDYENVESTYIDFKETLETNKPRSWLKTVSAFANTKGGILLYGVRDTDKKPVGIDNISAVSSKITELINAKIFSYDDSIIGEFLIIDITYFGHEFIEQIKDDNNWNKVKDVAKKVGSSSIDILLQIAAGVLTNKINNCI